MNKKVECVKFDCFKQPSVSVIIAVFNGEEFLEKTILSVINQTYQYIELIIIDGGSTDGTLDIIKKYNDEINYWVSEKDNGISDAFNKGIKIAKGDYINFQGDGDGFYTNNALYNAMQNIKNGSDIFISCQIQRIDCFDHRLYISKSTKKFNKKSLLFRMSLPHQGLLTHRSYFEAYGLFDIHNKYCMDYEHLLRSYHNFPNVVVKNQILANWRADGLGTGKELEIFKEYHKIKKNHKVSSNTILAIIYAWMLFKYYIKKILK